MEIDKRYSLYNKKLIKEFNISLKTFDILSFLYEFEKDFTIRELQFISFQIDKMIETKFNLERDSNLEVLKNDRNKNI